MGLEDTIDLDRKVEWSFGAYLGHCNSQREVVQQEGKPSTVAGMACQDEGRFRDSTGPKQHR